MAAASGSRRAAAARAAAHPRALAEEMEAFAVGLALGWDPVDAARRAWGGKFGDCTDAPHIKVWGANTALEKILGTPHPGEEVTGEGTRLGALAVRLWAPLLSGEVLS